MRLLILSVAIILLFILINSTPGIYFSSEGCDPPKLDAEYMGGENMVGTNLDLFINEQSLEDFHQNQNGFVYGKEYTMMLKTKDGEWMQYVVHTSHGKQQSTMGMLECEGKVSLFAMDFDSADFKWTAPTEEEINNNNKYGGNVILTTSYAPAYTNAYIQTFTIQSQSPTIKADL
eukprot:UN01129